MNKRREKKDGQDKDELRNKQNKQEDKDENKDGEIEGSGKSLPVRPTPSINGCFLSKDKQNHILTEEVYRRLQRHSLKGEVYNIAVHIIRKKGRQTWPSVDENRQAATNKRDELATPRDKIHLFVVLDDA